MGLWNSRDYRNTNRMRRRVGSIQGAVESTRRSRLLPSQFL